MDNLTNQIQSVLGDSSPIETSPSLEEQINQIVPNGDSKVLSSEGDQNYNGYCESFVEKMNDLPNMGGSAKEAWDNYSKQGKAVQGTAGIKEGDLIYFAPDSSNENFGHTGIYQGNNKMVSATYDGVKPTDLNDWLLQTGQSILGYVPMGGK